MEQVRKAKIEKARIDRDNKINQEAPHQPVIDEKHKEHNAKLLKDGKLEGLRVEDRLFKRSAEALLKYKGVASAQAAEYTYKPQISKKAK